MDNSDTGFVQNQPPSFAPRDLWADDAALQEAITREGACAHVPQLEAYGRLAGSTLLALSFDAHRDRPRLRTHDANGNRIDLIEYHPNYHAIMQAAVEHGVAGVSWAQSRPGAQVARAALSYLHYQVEPGSSCPLTMTHAAVPVLQRVPRLEEWATKAAAAQYDPRNLPIAHKAGITLGMGMTEKQGGSDVRRNATAATRLAAADEYTLRGHKWFFSAPMSDGFLVTAQAPGGLGCFLMPRWRPDGSRNQFRFVRLKDKLGDWSNASSEVEFDDAWAVRIGEEGKGIATILEMVMFTRLDCMLGSAALMRMALAQAVHCCRYRRAFGKRLIDQPLMRNVLADIALESEAATALAIRVAGAIDRANQSEADAAFARVATAVGKYWICKRAPAVVNEAQECLGGNGYVEDFLPARLYRQAPLNSIWEGSGNIQCLDVLRALSREPASVSALRRELVSARGHNADYDTAMAGMLPLLDGATQIPESQARLLVESLALALQAAVLLRAAQPMAATYCASRFAGAHGWMLGTLQERALQDIALERVLPADAD